jgi:hypothetical protein
MPSRETLWSVPLLVISLLVAMSLTIFLSPAIGIPLLVIAGVVGAIGWFRAHRGETADVEDFRGQVPGQDVEFTERDRETLGPSRRNPAHH